MQPDVSKALTRASSMQETTGLCDVRVLSSPSAEELYITATPAAGAPAAQAKAMYAEIARALRRSQAVIVEERLFAEPDVIAPALAAREAAYGDLDDGVAPTILATRGSSPLIGAQVHAIRGIRKPSIVKLGNVPVARTFSAGRYQWMTAAGLRGDPRTTAPEQARAAYEKADALLKQVGAGMTSIARTWIWMDDILQWYTPFNYVRTKFFTEVGLMDGSGCMPASTGIGVSPANGHRCAIDVFAAWGADDAVARFHAAGKQRSAYEYGSAFARAATARTPAGTTVFCSGTAAIDTKGATCFLDDIRGQVKMTVENVRAVLRDMHCADNDVVQALAYCVSPQVEDAFMADWGSDLPWPCLTMIGDVCRDDLLFEVEVTACPGAKRA